jgi:hypothetical protein
MNRLSLAEPPPADVAMARGRNAADLSRLRDRIEKHQEQQLADAAASTDQEHQHEAVRAEELRETGRIEAHSRALEVESRARWMRVISLQAVVGLGTFVVAETLLARASRREAAK